MGKRPPFETFTGATCKGCYALGSACGNCERCAWERAEMGKVNTSAPVHPFEIRISIGGNDWEYVLHAMRELTEHMEQRGPKDCGTYSGGYSGSYSLTSETRDITADQYRRELAAWHEKTA